MRRDPHIRSYADPGPYVPGSIKRFRWPEPYDDDVRRLREGVQENGRGLYVLRAPYDNASLLVEAYYPEDIRDDYAKRGLDPYRKADMGLGRLVVVAVYSDIKPPSEALNPLHVDELRRNNRNARADLKRQASAVYRKLELYDRQAEDEKPVFDRWYEFVRQATRDTRKFAMTPHVGPARSLSLGAAA